MFVALREQPFDPWDEVVSYQGRSGTRRGGFGATAVFVGTMRDFNDGEAVSSLFLEHYPGMTEASLVTIGAETRARWDVLDGLIIHRVGAVEPAEPIVLVAVWSVHRAAAFDACRYLMEQLKSRAPFWKREVIGDRQRWVARNTTG